MQILSVYYKHQQGGFNKRLYRLYAALARSGHQVHYVAVEPFPISGPGIHAHVLPLPGREKENVYFWLLFAAVAPVFCWWIARKYRIRQAVVFSAFYAFVCAPLVWTAGVRLTTFLRADVLREARLNGKPGFTIMAHYWLERIGLKVSNRVVANSRTLAAAVKERNPGLRPSVLPNSIDRSLVPTPQNRLNQRRLFGLPESGFVAVTAAPLNRVKNIGFLIRAFAVSGLKKARLVIIGDDMRQTGERRYLARLTTRLGLDHQVVFTGWLDSPQPLIAACDLFVFPSSQEGSPNALLEAIAGRIACLGSRIPEIAEVLGQAELLFDLSSPRQLAERLHRAGTQPAYLAHLADLTRKRLKIFNFDWDEQAVRLVTGNSVKV